MDCPYCGATNPEGSTVCATCGQPLSATAPSVPPAPPTAQEGYAQPPAAPPVPPAAYGQQQTYAPPPPPPSGYAQQPYAQPQVVAAVPVKSHLVMAILATLLCCLPFGAVGIVFASQVNSKLAMGDYAGAQQASKNAALWSWLAIGAGFIGAILYFALIMMGIVSSASMSY